MNDDRFWRATASILLGLVMWLVWCIDGCGAEPSTTTTVGFYFHDQRILTATIYPSGPGGTTFPLTLVDVQPGWHTGYWQLRIDGQSVTHTWPGDRSAPKMLAIFPPSRVLSLTGPTSADAGTTVTFVGNILIPHRAVVSLSWDDHRTSHPRLAAYRVNRRGPDGSFRVVLQVAPGWHSALDADPGFILDAEYEYYLVLMDAAENVLERRPSVLVQPVAATTTGAKL